PPGGPLGAGPRAHRRGARSPGRPRRAGRSVPQGRLAPHGRLAGPGPSGRTRRRHRSRRCRRALMSFPALDRWVKMTQPPGGERIAPTGGPHPRSIVPSLTVENYVKSIALIAARDKGKHPVGAGELAQALNVSPGTVTGMLKTLSEASLATYT